MRAVKGFLEALMKAIKNGKFQWRKIYKSVFGGRKDTHRYDLGAETDFGR